MNSDTIRKRQMSSEPFSLYKFTEKLDKPMKLKELVKDPGEIMVSVTTMKVESWAKRHTADSSGITVTAGNFTLDMVANNIELVG